MSYGRNQRDSEWWLGPRTREDDSELDDSQTLTYRGEAAQPLGGRSLAPHGLAARREGADGQALD